MDLSTPPEPPEKRGEGPPKCDAAQRGTGTGNSVTVVILFCLLLHEQPHHALHQLEKNLDVGEERASRGHSLLCNLFSPRNPYDLGIGKIQVLLVGFTIDERRVRHGGSRPLEEDEEEGSMSGKAILPGDERDGLPLVLGLDEAADDIWDFRLRLSTRDSK
ncbi:Golgi-to-ER vesicle coat component [Ascosphaera pollenicola]|nr:Golgi-to-ER vesicle coat component [Ascosphaera pollenicola]